MPIKDLYKSGKPVVSFEIFPPKQDADIGTIYDALGQMSGLSPDFISVTYGAGGGGNINKTAEIAAFIQREYRVEALAHLTCAGADITRMRRNLDEMRADGIRNILALRGDLVNDKAESDGYRHADELIAEISGRGDFCVGAACYPEGHIDCENLELDLDYLLLKQEAGADFLITQLFFENDVMFSFLDKARNKGVTLPISAGVMPILGQKQIERMIFMCGVSLPSSIVKLLHKYERDPVSLRNAGIEHAAKQMEGLLKQGVQGIHIYTMNGTDIAECCMRHIGRIS